MRTWQLQDAKAHLSELVKKAEKEGPQGITVHGHATAVVISSNEALGSFRDVVSYVALPKQPSLVLALHSFVHDYGLPLM